MVPPIEIPEMAIDHCVPRSTLLWSECLVPRSSQTWKNHIIKDFKKDSCLSHVPS